MIISGRVYVITLPLKTEFKNSQNSVAKRKLAILKVTNERGISGYGELPLFETPFYTQETLEMAIQEIKNEFKVLKGHTGLEYRFHTHSCGARSCIDMALYHLYSQESGRALSSLLGSVRSSIEAGIVFGLEPIEDVLAKSKEAIEQGYKRIKLKVDRESCIERVAKFRENFRESTLLLDGNMAFSLSDSAVLKKLEHYCVLLIEEPLFKKNFSEYAQLKKEMTTPIFADESYENFTELVQLSKLNLFEGVNLKLCKIGSIEAFKSAYKLLQSKGIKTMIGSMVESSLSKSFHAHFASWSHITAPDLSDYRRYFTFDILKNNLEVNEGKIAIQEDIIVDEKALKLVCSCEIELN